MKHLKLARQQAKRFWGKVQKTQKCWLWRGGVDKDGYGKFQLTARSRTDARRVGLHPQIHVRAHRLAYEMKRGAVRSDLVVMHKCDVPRCVRPSHLRAGTQAENRADCGAKGRNATGDRNGTHTHPESRPRGERHWKATITKAEVERIRQLKRAGVAIAEIARTLKCSYMTAWGVASGRTWRKQ